MIDAPIDHVAIVVKDLEAVLRLYTRTLGFSEVYREIVADQGVEAVGLRTGDAVIELLRPLSEDSPIARYRGEAADASCTTPRTGSPTFAPSSRGSRPPACASSTRSRARARTGTRSRSSTPNRPPAS